MNATSKEKMGGAGVGQYGDMTESKRGQVLNYNYENQMFKKKEGSPNGIGESYTGFPNTGAGSPKNSTQVIGQKLPNAGMQIGNRVAMTNNTKGGNNASPLKGGSKFSD